MPSYMISPERLAKFRVGSEVEATYLAHERYFRLHGKVVAIREIDGIRGFAVDWYDHTATSPAKVRRYVAHLHTPYELKLVYEEKWDESGELPRIPEPEPEQLRL